MNYLIDTHSHIYAEEFDADRDEAIRRAREAGVERLLLPAIDSESHGRLFDTVRRYPDHCTPMMGLHPTSINDNPRWREELALVERYLCSPPEGVGRFCAVGEIGLDYYWDDRFKAEQLEAFTKQCRLAATYDLPVAIHTRAAWKDMCRTVETETKAAREKGLRLRGVFHAFAEDADTYRQLKECGDFLFGIGGVGGYTVEALARSGVGALDLIDDDKVCLTNLNRQIIATRSTVGQYKVDVAAQRIHDIDPDIRVTTHRCFFGPETQDDFDFTQYDYVVDAIDTVTGKLALVMKCKEAGTPIICSMGAGNKMDPTRFEVTDIYKTSVCPLAKVMRTECRKRKIKHLKVVYSKEPVMTPIEDDSISCKDHCICPPGTQRKCTIRRSVPGSNAFVPSVAGLIIGGEVVKDLVGFVPMKG